MQNWCLLLNLDSSGSCYDYCYSWLQYLMHTQVVN